MRRWNQPHRKKARQEKAIDMMETQIGILKDVRGDIDKKEREKTIDKIQMVIKNTKANMKK
jgi:hypothetical protein